MMALRTADGVHIGMAHQVGGLFVLDALPSVASAQAATSTTTLSTWHNRLGHLHLAAIQAMATKGIVDGLKFVRSSGDDEKCVGCLEGKMARKPFPPSTKPNASEPLKLVHTELCGPITPALKGGAHYVLTLIDDVTRMCWIRLLKHKDATSNAIKQWVADVEKESGFKVKRFCSDGGGEYTSWELGDWLKGCGTAHEFSTMYTPQQNGAAERLNRTLMESARSLLSHAHAEKHWWGEAVTLATWIRNRCVTKALPNKTPLEAWSGTKPDVTDLRTFGCTCYNHVPDVTRTKLEAKARVAMYLGPSADHKAWRVWDLEHGKLVVSRDVVFYEDTFSSKSMNVPSVIIVPPPLDVADKADEADEVPTGSPPSTNEGENGSGAVGYDGYSLVAGGDEGGGDAMCLEAYTDTPSTYQGAMSSAEAAEWECELQEEYDSLMANDVYELVPMPPGAYLVGSHWVFKKKLGPNGEVERYKARLVTQGYTQKEGLHYNETFAPVAKSATLRTLLALAGALDLEVEQLDVKTAFLYGRLKEEVYMKQPPGFDDDSGRVCKLKRTIYGLKQSPRAWYTRIVEHLLSLGFVRSECDHALYVLNKDEKKIVLLLYVDDLLLVSDSKTLVADMKTKLAAEFSMRDLGAVSHCLWMHIDRDRGNKTLALHQHKYLESVVDRFGMIEGQPTPTPMEAGFHPLAVSDENPMDPESAKAFHSVVGSCMYAAVSTRPDLSFPVGVLGRVVSNPMVEHVRASRRLLRYIKGTTRMGLHYEKEPVVLQGYTDADWAGDPSTRQSTSGYIFTLVGGAISWQSKRQNLIALSSTEAEYVALTRGGTEAVWLRRLLAELGHQQEGPTPIYVDNQGAIGLAKNSVLHGRTKHIQIRHQFIRKLVEDNEVELRYIKTKSQPAGFLTKPLHRDPLHACCARVLQRFGFQYSSQHPTPMPTGHSLSAPPSDESVEQSGPYPELVGCLMTLRRSGDSAFVTGLYLQSWLWFCLDGAMAAQELHWLAYLLTNLGERPRSPPVLYVDNKAMLARELQQRGQLRLSYVASRTNTTDVFTKALWSGDQQRFCTALGLLPTLPHLLVA
ncbi:unnamed protein product [Closterium sp. NIES-54]